MDNTSVGKLKLHTLPPNSIYPKNKIVLGVINLKINLNKKEKQLPENLSLNDLIFLLKLNPKGIVVEVNLNIINQKNWKNFILKDSDSVEIITFMGGG